MSEEIIGILNEFNINSPLDYNNETIRKVLKQAIQGILDLYNKEKEKNKELKRKYENAKDMYIIKDNEIQIEYISKDKIKEILTKHGGSHFIAKSDIEELLEERN